MVITVGELRKELEKFDDDMEISFGNTTFSGTPLIFYRTKQRGKDLLQIELNEYDYEIHSGSESDIRITVGELKSHIDLWDDDVEITFGSSLDANELSFKSIKPVLTIDFTQE